MNLHLTYMRSDACYLINRTAWTLCCLIGSVLLAGCGGDPSPTTIVDQDSPVAEALPISGTVTVEITMDPDDASKTIAKTAEISSETTLETVMANLEGVEIELSGQGVTAFVQSINGVETSADRGWTYTLDGKFATKGIGSITLQSGQTVQWKFTSFEEAMK